MCDEETREENIADIDFSQIRTSIQVGGRMIEQILNGIHYGSPEVRLLLLDECDIILECRVCRGLFRSLPNFVAHKRVYCKQAYIMTKQELFHALPPEDEIVVVQPTAPEDDVHSNTNGEQILDESEQTPDQKVRETITQINDGLLGKSEMYKLYSRAAEKVEKQKRPKKTLDAVLTKIASNPNAVRVSFEEHNESRFPTPSSQHKLEQQFKKPEVSVNVQASSRKRTKGTPCQNMNSVSIDTTKVDKHSPKISPPAKAHVWKVKVKDATKDHSPNIPKVKKDGEGTSMTSGRKLNSCSVQVKALKYENMKLRGQCEEKEKRSSNILDLSSLKCLKCDVVYSSRKTLLYHVQMVHSGLRTFFPCPNCSSVFFYFWGLTRHLRVTHKKTTNQINKMRKTLRDAAFTKNVTKQCVQAKDQLEYTTEVVSSDEEIMSPGENEDEQVETKPDISSHMIDVKPPPEVKKSGGKSKATVKHTSTTIKHTFTPRFVPTSNNSGEENMLKTVVKSDQDMTEDVVSSDTHDMSVDEDTTMTTDDDDMSESPTKTEKKFSHQLVCDNCEKVFWKKNRLTNHRKFCVPQVQTPPEPLSCSNCGKTFLRTTQLRQHSRVCKKAVKSELINDCESSPLETKNCYNCPTCDRSFEKKVGLESHRRSCQKSSSKKTSVKKTDKTDGKDEKEKTNPGSGDAEDDVMVVEEIWIQKQPGRPSEKVKSNRIYVTEAEVGGRLHCQDTKKLSAIVDEVDLKCTKCGQEFTSVSNLRRHAIRHLGWKRYKCKLCRFSSYNKSECNTHIVRTHSERYRFNSAESLIVDLNKEASRIRSQKKQQTLTARQMAQRVEHKVTTVTGEDKVQVRKTGRRGEKKEEETEEIPPAGVDMSRKFNISTRNSPRKFDIRPYQHMDNLQTLTTRKGHYLKPSLKKGQSGKCADSGQTEKDKKDDTSNVANTEVSENPDIDSTETEEISKPSDSNKVKSSPKLTNEAKKESGKSGSVKGSPKKVDDPEKEDEKVNSAKNSPKQDDESKKDGDKVKETSKGRKRVKSDGFETPSKALKPGASEDVCASKKPSGAQDAKNTDFLAPWPRAPEPMSVKEMFALIQPAPRAGVGRRKSVGDDPVGGGGDKREQQAPSGVSTPRPTTRTTEGKTRLCATLPRRSTPTNNSLSLSLRTCRPGVDWSQEGLSPPSSTSKTVDGDSDDSKTK